MAGCGDGPGFPGGGCSIVAGFDGELHKVGYSSIVDPPAIAASAAAPDPA